MQAFRSGCYVDNLQGQIRDLKHEIGDLKEDKQAARDVVRASVQYKNKLAECPELSTALAELSVRCGGAAACGANRVGRNESGAVSLPTPTGFASGLPLLDVGGLPSPACTPSSPDRTVTSKYNQLKELQTELARLKEENAKLAKEKLDSGRHIAEIERLKEQLAEAEAKAQAAAAGPGTPRVGGASALLDLHQQVSRLQTSLDAAEEARRKSALEVARLSGELEAAKQNARSGGAAFAAPAPGSPRGSPATSPRHLVDGGASSAELASKLATAKDMIARLQRELAESQTAVVGSKVDFTLLEPLQAEIASLNAKLAEREKEVAKLQSVAAAVVPAAPAEADPQQLAEFRFKLAAAEAQAKGLNDEVAKLRNQLASSELVEADLKSQLAAREEAYEALRADLAAQEEQVELLARSSGNFDVVLAELNAELAAKRTEVAKLTAELGAAAEGRRAAHEGHKAALAATGAEISALQKQLKELKDANASMTAAAAAAASKTHNVTELEVLVKELASFKDQVRTNIQIAEQNKGQEYWGLHAMC